MGEGVGKGTQMPGNHATHVDAEEDKEGGRQAVRIFGVLMGRKDIFLESDTLFLGMCSLWPFPVAAFAPITKGGISSCHCFSDRWTLSKTLREVLVSLFSIFQCGILFKNSSNLKMCLHD